MHQATTFYYRNVKPVGIQLGSGRKVPTTSTMHGARHNIRSIGFGTTAEKRPLAAPQCDKNFFARIEPFNFIDKAYYVQTTIDIISSQIDF
jgi:hypothetical protein